ncbi:MAG: hypothetical protein KGH61_01920, partial [Candidatus Micrarchaeota archaeon]|nr:hypothetical protein [Candidatus Micrarchaeota archaeon]
AEKAGLIEYNGEKYETDRWKFLIKQATEHINFCLTLVSFVLWYSAIKGSDRYKYSCEHCIRRLGNSN